MDENTEVLTPSGWRKRDAISAGDMVAGFEVSDGTVVWQAVKAVIIRPLSHDERFVGVKSDHLDIRVTGNHRLVVACSTSRKESRLKPNWQLETATKASRRKSIIWIPVAGTMNVDDDTTITDEQLQSPGLAMVKDYGTLSRRQLYILVHALWRRYGVNRKTSGSVGTLSIPFGSNISAAEFIQGMCVTRGMRCNLSTAYLGNVKLYINPHKTRSVIKGTSVVSKKDARITDRIRKNDADAWCVDTLVGSVLTRRNGKVAVVGGTATRAAS